MQTAHSHDSEQRSTAYPQPRQWSRDEFDRLCESGIIADFEIQWIDGEIVQASYEPFRWSLKQYEQLDELGCFQNNRVQLIDGEILVMPPMNGPHGYASIFTFHELVRIFGGIQSNYDVRFNVPLPFVNSAPEPDVSVMAGNAITHVTVLPGPALALLVVEVSDSTLWYDIGEKASLYASVGIADYWVIDIPNEQVRIFRDPQPDATQPFRFGYSQVTFHPRTDTISPLAMPNGMLLVNDLIPQP